MDKNEITFNINSQILKEFQRTVAMEKKDLSKVIEKIIINYIAESNTPEDQIDTNSNGRDLKYRKALVKVKLWKNRPQQNNHKILRAFWEIEDEIGFVTIDALEKRCSNKEKFSGTYVEKFHANFEQMKTDKGNINGKVFEIEYKKVVRIWDAVYLGITQYKDSFVRR